MLKIAVITVSDRASRGEYADMSGPKIKEMIEAEVSEVDVSLTVVPDEWPDIRLAIEANLGKDYILTTGGTGISPRDITPEVTREICEKELPGISEMLRRESYLETRNAVFSRSYSGMKGKTMIINFPGSVRAVTLCTALVLPLLEHGVHMLQGNKHE